MADQELKAAALALYKPPFKFESGYFFDAEGRMVADKHEAEMMRVRGWGRISYKDNAEALQDMVGALIAEAMTVAWNTRAEPLGVPTVQAGMAVESLLESLKDPAFVHANMLAGHIAKIEMSACAHLHGEETVNLWNAAPSQPVAGKPTFNWTDDQIITFAQQFNLPPCGREIVKMVRELFTTTNAGKETK